MSKPIKDVQLFNDLCAVETLLEKDGWCKDVSQDSLGQRCLGWAASEVAWANSGDNDRWDKLMKALGDGDGGRIVGFNDAPETTFEDVRARIRAARDALI
jgi:hypothetical protein